MFVYLAIVRGYFWLFKLFFIFIAVLVQQSLKFSGSGIAIKRVNI